MPRPAGTVGTRRSRTPGGLRTLAEISPEGRASGSLRAGHGGVLSPTRGASVQPPPRSSPGSALLCRSPGCRRDRALARRGRGSAPDLGSLPSLSRSRPYSLPGRSLQRVPSTPPPPSMRKKKRVAEKSRRQRTSPSRCP